MNDVHAHAELAAAMLTVRARMQQTADPVELSGFVAQVGLYLLERLGFKVTESADVQIRIGADEGPDKARITLTWPLPPGSSSTRTHHPDERIRPHDTAP